MSYRNHNARQYNNYENNRDAERNRNYQTRNNNDAAAAARQRAAAAEAAAAAERKRIEDERIRLGHYEPYLLDIRPRRPALNPKYTRGSGTPKYLGEEFFNSRTGEAISDDDAWLLAENRRRKYPELFTSHNPKEPLSKVSRGKYANAITKRAKAAQQTFDRFTPFGLEYRAGNHYGQVDYSKHGEPIPKGERWLDHNEEIEQILAGSSGNLEAKAELESLKNERASLLEKDHIQEILQTDPHIRTVRIKMIKRKVPNFEPDWSRLQETEKLIAEKQPLFTASMQTEPVRFWWDKDADLTPVESVKRIAAVLPTRQLQVRLPLQNLNVEAVQYELPSKHNENIGVRRTKALPFEKATPFKAASAFNAAKPASKYWR